ncbi:MAG: hypothetical protein MRZ79_09450 [Bacteroidia bacterium]|nr:hypothetical protein [Bacteroidia bacterium]
MKSKDKDFFSEEDLEERIKKLRKHIAKGEIESFFDFFSESLDGLPSRARKKKKWIALEKRLISSSGMYSLSNRDRMEELIKDEDYRRIQNRNLKKLISLTEEYKSLGSEFTDKNRKLGLTEPDYLKSFLSNDSEQKIAQEYTSFNSKKIIRYGLYFATLISVLLVIKIVIPIDKLFSKDTIHENVDSKKSKTLQSGIDSVRMDTSHIEDTDGNSELRSLDNTRTVYAKTEKSRIISYPSKVLNRVEFNKIVCPYEIWEGNSKDFHEVKLNGKTVDVRSNLVPESQNCFRLYYKIGDTVRYKAFQGSEEIIKEVVIEEKDKVF